MMPDLISLDSDAARVERGGERRDCVDVSQEMELLGEEGDTRYRVHPHKPSVVKIYRSEVPNS